MLPVTDSLRSHLILPERTGRQHPDSTVLLERKEILVTRYNAPTVSRYRRCNHPVIIGVTADRFGESGDLNVFGNALEQGRYLGHFRLWDAKFPFQVSLVLREHVIRHNDLVISLTQFEEIVTQPARDERSQEDVRSHL